MKVFEVLNILHGIPGDTEFTDDLLKSPVDESPPVEPPPVETEA